MKRKIAILLVVILMFGYAYADSEIFFQAVPWLADETETLQILVDSGLVRDREKIAFVRDDAFYLVPTEDGTVLPDNIQEMKDVCISIELNETVKGKIAGYPLKGLTLTFAYDGTFRLISVRVNLINATYGSLKEKISKVYGEGESTVTEEFVESNIWKGDNNSAVLLYTDSDGADFILLYGRLDAKDILTECLHSDPDDVSGL